MAHIALAGVLLDPTGEFSVGDKVRFTHQSTTGNTMKSAVSVLKVPPNGAYSVNLEYGLVLVEYNDYRLGQYRNLGIATVNATNTATSIPELLNAVVPVSSAELIQFQAIQSNCVAAQNSASASAAAALVSQNAAAASAATLDLINDLSQSYIFDTVVVYQASTIVFPIGKTIHLNDREADFKVAPYSAGADGWVDINNTSSTQSIKISPVNNRVTSRQVGAKGDGSGDDSLPINSILSQAISLDVEVALGDGSFRTLSAIVVPAGVSLTGNGYAQDEGVARTRILPRGGNNGVEIGYNSQVSNFNVEGDSTGGADGLYVPDGRNVFEDIGCHLMGGNGFRIGSKIPAGNANLFRGANLYAKLNEASGMYVHHDATDLLHPDVNAGQINGADLRRNKGDGLRVGACQDSEFLNVVSQLNDGTGVNLEVNADSNYLPKMYTEGNVINEALINGKRNVLSYPRDGAGLDEWVINEESNRVIGKSSSYPDAPYLERTPKWVTQLRIAEETLSGYWDIGKSSTTRDLVFQMLGTGSAAKVILPALAIAPDGNGNINKFVRSGFTVAAGTVLASSTKDVVVNVPKGVTGDFINIMPNVAIPAGVTWSAWMSSATQATVRISNVTTSDIVAGSPTFDYQLWG
jgi:hypothetical protein